MLHVFLILIINNPYSSYLQWMLRRRSKDVHRTFLKDLRMSQRCLSDKMYCMRIIKTKKVILFKVQSNYCYNIIKVKNFDKLFLTKTSFTSVKPDFIYFSFNSCQNKIDHYIAILIEKDLMS